MLESTVPVVDVLALLDTHRVAGKQLHAGRDDRLALVISRENLHEEPRLRSALLDRFGGRVALIDDLGAVSVVGAGINASFENLRRGTNALAAEGIAHRDVATSSFRITWTVGRNQLDEAVRTLHRAFLGTHDN